MTDRERYLETLLFGRPDRIPFLPGLPRESTLKAWRGQGLAEGADWEEEVRKKIGIEPAPKREKPPVLLKAEMIPQFEEKVLEEKERTLIVQDWKGNVCEISREYDVSYLRIPKDFVTRKWIRCPVENRADWEAMKKRYDPDDPARIPEGLAALGKKLSHRDHVIGISVPGPFWQMREWLGFENLCMLFLDDPGLAAEMTAFWEGFVARLLDNVLARFPVDFVYVTEDIAYKEKAMISPAMNRKFLQPCYRRWHGIVRANRCPLYIMDSDGFIGELMPIWIESGFNVCYPLEAAAGNDLNGLRKTFGKKMAFIGGIDKRAMARGGAVIRAEMSRIKPAVRSGGYIPGCDHGVPSDVGWKEFREYCEILARMTGWK